MPAPRKQQACPPRKAEEILAAAEELFAEHGFEGVSVSAVAKRAGVCKSSIFHHYGSKEELYYAVLRRAHLQLSGRLLGVTDGGNSDVGRGLHGVASAYLDNLQNHDRLARIVLREVLERPPGRAKDLAERVFGENFARLVAFLQAGQREGQVRADVDPATAVVLLVGACVFFFQSQEVLRHLPGVDFAAAPQTYINRLVDILRRGIAPQPKE